MVEICSLASGSNGNCYYIGDDNEAVIIDAGIGWRRFSERMKTAGLDVCRVRALFVTHEHRDHSGSAKVISNKLAIPVYATPLPLRRSPTWATISVYCHSQNSTTPPSR